jgi:outer membrane lipoprotein LolB
MAIFKIKKAGLQPSAFFFSSQQQSCFSSNCYFCQLLGCWVLRGAVLGAALLALSGCGLFTRQAAQQATSPTAELHHMQWSARQRQLQEITDWNIQGALGITYKNKTEILSFSWQRQQPNYRINLHGPMHLASIHISGDANSATLQKSATNTITASSPEELLRQQVGWELPLSNLNYWIRGLPMPTANSASMLNPSNQQQAAAKLKFDAYNHLVQLIQDGWQINYSNFRSFNGIDLPTKIYLRYASTPATASAAPSHSTTSITTTPPSSQLLIKLVIKKWE